MELLFVSVTLHGIQDPKFPDQGVNLCPLKWKRGVPTTGLPGKFVEAKTPTLWPPDEKN